MPGIRYAGHRICRHIITTRRTYRQFMQMQLQMQQMQMQQMQMQQMQNLCICRRAHMSASRCLHLPPTNTTRRKK